MGGWIDYVPALLAGARITLLLTAVSMFFGAVIGFAIAMMRLSSSRILVMIAITYTGLIRGLPLLVQIFYIYFGLPLLTGIRMPAIVAGAVALSLYTGGFMSETVRSGIMSINSGQMEAGRSLGFSYWASMRLIVLPQAIWTMLPNLANQFVITLKNTSLLSVIGIMELTMAGQTIYSINFDTMRVLTMVAVVYLGIFIVVERISAILEAKLAQ